MTDLLLHPIRLRLVSELAGRQMTPRQLALALPDIPQATLYRHLNRLLEGGLLEVVAEQVVNGATERTYGVVGEDAVEGEAEETHSAEAQVRRFSTFVGMLIEAFSRQAHAAGDSAEEKLPGGYEATTVYLSDEEADQLWTQVSGLLAQAAQQQSSPDQKRYTVASVLIPTPMAENQTAVPLYKKRITLKPYPTDGPKGRRSLR